MNVSYLHTSTHTYLFMSENRQRTGMLPQRWTVALITATTCRHLDRFVTVLTDTLATLYDACVARLHGGRVSSHHEDLTASVRGG